MRITVVGAGYVGLVSGVGFADMGNHVTCVDVDKNKVAQLKEGKPPIYEPGLSEMMTYNQRSGRLNFTHDLKDAVRGVDAVFIAVGTPPDEDGSADLSHVLAVAQTLGEVIEGYTVVAVKSTVPVGSCLKVKAAIEASAKANGRKVEFDVVSNPEFLKEGSAIEDFLRPDRIVVGSDSDKASAVMQKLYEPFVLNGHPILIMDIASSEMTKYAANAMLATKVSFMNEIARLCETLGADVTQVRRGIGSDRRIGYQFIHAGIGYGGSCFPKDVQALVMTGMHAKEDMNILRAVENVNNTQRAWFMKKVSTRFKGDLKGKHFALWGLAFKPGTDDMRMAPSIDVIDYLIKHGATVTAFDPVATDSAKQALGTKAGLKYADDAYSATDGADALILVTEWREFRRPDFEELKSRMKSRVIFDARNQYTPSLMTQAEFEYHGVGR